MEACHNDGNSSNNTLANLRWDTPKENAADKRHHGTHLQGSRISWATLSEDDVQRIRELGPSMRQKDIASMFRTTQSRISRILSRECWRHV